MVEKLVKQLNKPQTGDSSKTANTSLDGCIFTCEFPDSQHCTKLQEFLLLSLLYIQTSIMVWIHQKDHYAQACISDRMGLHILTYRFSWIGTKEVLITVITPIKIPGAGKFQKKLLHWIKRFFTKKKRQKLKWRLYWSKLGKGKFKQKYTCITAYKNPPGTWNSWEGNKSYHKLFHLFFPKCLKYLFIFTPPIV